MLGRLEAVLAWSLDGRFVNTKEKAFAGSISVLMHLSRAFEKSDRDLFHRVIGSMITVKTLKSDFRYIKKWLFTKISAFVAQSPYLPYLR